MRDCKLLVFNWSRKCLKVKSFPVDLIKIIRKYASHVLFFDKFEISNLLEIINYPFYSTVKYKGMEEIVIGCHEKIDVGDKFQISFTIVPEYFEISMADDKKRNRIDFNECGFFARINNRLASRARAIPKFTLRKGDILNVEISSFGVLIKYNDWPFQYGFSCIEFNCFLTIIGSCLFNII